MTSIFIFHIYKKNCGMKFPCSTTIIVMASMLGNDEQHNAMDFPWGTTMMELRLQWLMKMSGLAMMESGLRNWMKIRNVAT
jgi:hypothetical protein